MLITDASCVHCLIEGSICWSSLLALTSAAVLRIGDHIILWSHRLWVQLPSHHVDPCLGKLTGSASHWQSVVCKVVLSAPLPDGGKVSSALVAEALVARLEQNTIKEKTIKRIVCTRSLFPDHTRLLLEALFRHFLECFEIRSSSQKYVECQKVRF